MNDELKSVDYSGAVEYWNKNYEKIQTQHKGKFVVLLPAESSLNGQWDVIPGDTYAQLELVAKEKGYQYPYIELVATGKEKGID